MKSTVFALRPDGFVSCLALAMLLAYLTPSFGSARGMFSIHCAADLGVLLIFFFYGVGMSPGSLRDGLSNWRLHWLVPLSTFLIFPLVVLGAYGIAESCGGTATERDRLLWLGIVYVAALPSTVSSSVVMVSIARGNMPAAIFNAGLSGLLGVFLTPLWMGLFLAGQPGGRDEFRLVDAIVGLVVLVALPIGLGMLLNTRLGGWMTRNRPFVKYFDQGVVLLIVYTSFSDSFNAKAFDGFGLATLLSLGAGMLALFFAVYGIIRLCCRALRFNREDTITALFCGSKKSLMHGMAMSKVLFAGLSGLGVVLLPIMLYHALQLVVVSVLARRYAADREG